MAATRVAGRPIPIAERLARGGERLLRIIGDARIGAILLLLTGLANAAAASLPGGPRLLDAWPYAALLGCVALSGVAGVAVRAPTAWREWRRPGAVSPGADALSATVAALPASEVQTQLRRAGYRVRQEGRGERWAIHGVRRGWSRFAGLASHLALVAVVLGAAIGAAFGSETTFSLLPGHQAPLDAPRPGFSAAVRLDSFDAEFGSDGLPRRLDAHVTLLTDGEPIRSALLRVNQPADFAGYMVHAWTYGPAVRIRATSLAGATLIDGPVALDQVRAGTPVGAADLPALGSRLSLALTDAAANQLTVSLVAADGLVDTARLRPGESARVGDVQVELAGFEAWVTFLSRRDPGLLILFGGVAALCASLAIGLWLPRRRLSVRPAPAGDALGLTLRGERFDRPGDELERLVRRLEAAR